jgi:GrpB-like predicted nucleotidyltransferase (UPF0157 family)
MRQVKVVPYNPEWAKAFEIEARGVAEALGGNVAIVHHIGSTAIPGIYAKPIIDLLVEVVDLIRVDDIDRTRSMVALGYEVMGEFGIVGRRYFRKDNRVGDRTHHVHIFEVGSAQVERHLAFRDYAIAHPAVAREYGELKRKLAEQHPTDIDSYMDGKDKFIKEMDKGAAQWRFGSIESEC